MEQKDYKLEILKSLLKEKSHVRGLAKTLGTNHMTIARKINELYNCNAVDYKTEGKNKVYFIKKTAEAKQYAYITEQYKLLALLKKYSELRRIIREIQNRKDINMAVLFGSYAKGNAKKDSDIDVYIDTNSKKLKGEIEMLDTRLSVKIGKYDKENLLIKEIEKDHVIIKGVETFYEKNRFFD